MQPALIEFERVSVARGATLALDDISLRIGAGEHVAIIGPNGCGKSTFIKAITRECYPLCREGSSLTILGGDHWNVFELRSLLGIVSSDLMTICTRDLTGRDMVLSGFFSSIGIWPHHAVTPEMHTRAERALQQMRKLPATWRTIVARTKCRRAKRAGSCSRGRWCMSLAL